MPKQLTGANKVQTTFVTNDWRQLSAATPNEQYWGLNEDMKVGGLNFEDKPAAPVPLVGAGAQGDAAMGGGHSIGNLRIMAQDIAWLKQDSQQMKAIVMELQKDRDNLRTAIRKLKVENVRIKAKLKRLSDAVKTSGGADKMDTDQFDEDVEYEDLRQYLLVGGPKDPFAIQFNDATIQDVYDPKRLEHKTCERYYWYKMAETFDDKEAMEKILTADDGRKAEEAMKAIKNFNQAQWDAVKAKVWEDAQRLKFAQHRFIKNMLVKSGSIYIAVASQDKILGTGWRKQREEASRTQLWDGENLGGKILMKLRDEFNEGGYAWQTSKEEEEALKQFNDNKRNIWKSFASIRYNKAKMGDPSSLGVFPPPMMKLGGAGYGKTGGLKKRRQM